jgi:hypothetical protein
MSDEELRRALDELEPEQQREIADVAHQVRQRAQYVEALARALNKRAVPRSP